MSRYLDYGLSKGFARALVLAVLCSSWAWAQTTITSFTGGDLGDGLDLEGVFPYAVNV